MGHPPGSIIIACGDLARYSAFNRALTSLITPYGTNTVWGIGADICKNANSALAKRRGEWVWILGDDHVFAPDTLMRLLDRQVDIVSPVVAARKWPFSTFVFEDDPEKGCMRIVNRDQLPSGGLHQYAGCSGAGMLIRNYVLEALTPPYYEAGKIQDGELNEDCWLMHKMRQAGFSIYVDFDVRMGHQTPAVVWPRVNEQGQWEIECDLHCRVPAQSGTHGFMEGDEL